MSEILCLGEVKKIKVSQLGQKNTNPTFRRLKHNLVSYTTCPYPVSKRLMNRGSQEQVVVLSICVVIVLKGKVQQREGFQIREEGVSRKLK